MFIHSQPYASHPQRAKDKINTLTVEVQLFMSHSPASKKVSLSFRFLHLKKSYKLRLLKENHPIVFVPQHVVEMSHP